MPDIFQVVDDLEPDALQRLVDRLEFRGTYAPFIAMREAYLDLLDLPARARVCELGCGTGVVSRAVAGRTGFDGTVLGTDLSRALVAEAERRASAEGLGNVTFRAVAAGAVDEPDGSCDLVLLHTLISHVADPDPVLAKARRLARRGGTIVLFDGDYTSLTCHTGSPNEDARAVGAVLDAVVAQPRIMRDLPTKLRQMGLPISETRGDVLLEAGSSEFFRGMMETYVPMAVKAGRLAGAEAEAWLARFRDAIADRRFFGACNFVTYIARRLSGVSTCGTDWGFSRREDFWFIAAIRSEDETEIRAGEAAGGSGRQGHPTCDAATVLGR